MPQAEVKSGFPRTRKELVNYLWSRGVWANIAKEGPVYCVTFAGKIMTTHTRRITDFSFAEWERRIVAKNFPLY